MTDYILKAIESLKTDTLHQFNDLKTDLRNFVSQAEFKAVIDGLREADNKLTGELQKHISDSKEETKQREERARAEATGRESKTRWFVGIAFSLAMLITTGVNVVLSNT